MGIYKLAPRGVSEALTCPPSPPSINSTHAAIIPGPRPGKDEDDSTGKFGGGDLSRQGGPRGGERSQQLVMPKGKGHSRARRGDPRPGKRSANEEASKSRAA
jgi:hypothetical protein